VSALGKRLAIQPTNRLTSFIKTSARLTLSLNSELDSVVTLELVVLVVWVVLVVFLQVTSSVMHASLPLRLWGMHLFSRHDFLTAIFSANAPRSLQNDNYLPTFAASTDHGRRPSCHHRHRIAYSWRRV
jgi:hypothetical protein